MSDVRHRDEVSDSSRLRQFIEPDCQREVSGEQVVGSRQHQLVRVFDGDLSHAGYVTDLCIHIDTWWQFHRRSFLTAFIGDVGVLASEGWWEAWQPLPQGNQELLVIKDKVGRSPGEAMLIWGYSIFVKQVCEMWYFPFSALTLLVGRQEGHIVCIKLGVSLLVVTIWLMHFAQLIAPVVAATTVDISSKKTVQLRTTCKYDG